VISTTSRCTPESALPRDVRIRLAVLGVSSQRTIKLAMQVKDATSDRTRFLVVNDSERGKYAPLVALRLRDIARPCPNLSPPLVSSAGVSAFLDLSRAGELLGAIGRNAYKQIASVQRLGKASSSNWRCEPRIISVMRAEAPAAGLLSARLRWPSRS
jgi:hypothetical protein